MDKILEEVIKQAPVIGANVLIVYLFLQFIKSQLEEWKQIVKDNTKAIMDNSEMRGRSTKIMERLENRLGIEK